MTQKKIQTKVIVFSFVAVVLVGLAPAFSFAADLGGYDYGYGYDASSYGYDYGYGADVSGYDYGYGYDQSGYDYGYGYDQTGYDYGYGYDQSGYDYGYGSDVSGYDYGYGSTSFYPDTAFYPDSEFYPDTAYYSDWPYTERNSYYDSSCGCYSYSTPSYSYGTRGYSTPTYSSSGYSMVKPVSFGSPSYPVSTYTPTRSTGGSSSSYVSNVSNTNTTITNVDNSINDSFNNYNSGNVYTAPLTYATPQYPVVYTQPAPYCQIYQASSASGSGITAVYLSWTSSNASSAYLSTVGSVPVNGSKTVWPTSGTTYTLTVYGTNGQSATCYTTVNAYSAPYVSLTQIPYTGFDFGTLGNAMYWAGLVIFALGAGYLAVYYVPALALAGARTRTYAPVVAAKAPILVEKEIATEKVAPVVAAIRKAGTIDTMAIVDSKDGSMPKIVIDRS